MGNVCTITKCRRKREHTIDSFQNPVSFQENGVREEKITSLPESKLSSESGMICFVGFLQLQPISQPFSKTYKFPQSRKVLAVELFKSYIFRHDTDGEKCVEIVKTLHAKCFPLGAPEPNGIVSVNY